MIAPSAPSLWIDDKNHALKVSQQSNRFSLVRSCFLLANPNELHRFRSSSTKSYSLNFPSAFFQVGQEGRGKVLWVYAKHLRNSASQIYSAKICESPGHQANEIRFYGSTSVVVKHLASSRFATKSQRRSYAASSSCGTVCYNSTCVAISFAIRLYSC